LIISAKGGIHQTSYKAIGFFACQDIELDKEGDNNKNHFSTKKTFPL
jgi:hypothetical protein